MATTLAHVVITKLSQTIDSLIIGKTEALLDAILALVGCILTSVEGGLGIREELFAIIGEESNLTSLLIEVDGDVG